MIGAAVGQTPVRQSNQPCTLSGLASPPVIQPQGLEALLQHRPTMNMAGSPTMPSNPYALAAWLRNCPTAFGKRKIY